MHQTLTTALLALLPLTLAANIPITVGDGALAFNPSSLTANIGDTLSFSYYPKNHSVTQSSFANPCHPIAGDGFFSGFQPLSAGPGPVEFVVEVNDTLPIWIYCSQLTHCQKGMAMVVNPPAAPSPNTLAAYQLAAAAQKTNSTSPPHIAGGFFVSHNSTSTTWPSSTASSTASSGAAWPSGSGAWPSGAGSASGAGSGSTTGVDSQSSPIVGFTGAAGRMVTGLGAVCGGAGLVVFALFCI